MVEFVRHHSKNLSPESGLKSAGKSRNPWQTLVFEKKRVESLKKKFSPQLIHNLTTSYPHCPQLTHKQLWIKFVDKPLYTNWIHIFFQVHISYPQFMKP